MCWGLGSIIAERQNQFTTNHPMAYTGLCAGWCPNLDDNILDPVLARRLLRVPHLKLEAERLKGKENRSTLRARGKS